MVGIRVGSIDSLHRTAMQCTAIRFDSIRFDAFLFGRFVFVFNPSLANRYFLLLLLLLLLLHYTASNIGVWTEWNATDLTRLDSGNCLVFRTVLFCT